jgi:hypothetical protein
MTKFFLNLQRKGAGFSPCVATCSITGDPIGFKGSQREFYPESTLVAALEVAGIAEHRFAFCGADTPFRFRRQLLGNK